MIDHRGLQLSDGAGDGLTVEEIDLIAAPTGDRCSALGEKLDEMAPRESACAGDEDDAHVREPYWA